MNSGAQKTEPRLSAAPSRALAAALGVSAHATGVWRKAFKSAGVELEIREPASLAAARRMVAAGECTFVLTQLPKSGDRLWPNLGILALAHLPVIALTEQPVDDTLLERARKMGVSAVHDAKTAPSDDLLQNIIGASRWVAASLKRAPLADLLQLVAGGEPALIDLTCEHASPVVTTRLLKRSCVGGHAHCAGFHVRIYLSDGDIRHVEGTGCEGAEALGRALEVQSGELRVHEMYIEPAEANLDAPLQRALMDAAIVHDHRLQAEAEDGPKRRPTVPPPPPQGLGRVATHPGIAGPRLDLGLTVTKTPTPAPMDSPTLDTGPPTGSGAAVNRRIMIPPMATPAEALADLAVEEVRPPETDIIDLSADIQTIDTPPPIDSAVLDRALAAVPGARSVLEADVEGRPLMALHTDAPQMLATVGAMTGELTGEIATALGWGACRAWACTTAARSTMAAQLGEDQWVVVEADSSNAAALQIEALLKATESRS